MRASPVLFFLCFACQPVTVEVKPRTLNVTATGTSAECNTHLLPAAEIDVEAMLKEAGLDPNQGCLLSSSFSLVLDQLDITAGAGCTTPRGTLTLSEVAGDFSCLDGTTQHLSVQCSSTALDASNADAIYHAVNDCFDRAEMQLQEPLRKTVNTCKPKKMSLFPVGMCSAGSCFAVSAKIGFRLNQATAQLGGSCP